MDDKGVQTVILQRGYGLRDMEKKLPMTHLTVQPIASVTKSFTVAGLATLVREGKLSWDKPVRDYMPDFKMFNDTTTLNATPRDLVTHRTGLPRHDYSWFNATATREELYKRLQYLEPSAQLRATWQHRLARSILIWRTWRIICKCCWPMGSLQAKRFLMPLILLK